MHPDWTIRTIQECASDEPYSTQIGPFGNKIRAKIYTPTGAPVLRGTQVNTDGRYHDGDYVFVSEEYAEEELQKFVCEADDIILCHKGTLGKIGIIPRNGKFDRYIMGNSMMKVRCNRDLIEPLYLYYFLCSGAGQHYLFSRVSQVGVPQIQRPLTTLRECEVPLPPIEEQRAIASILGALDDKIELNRRMNATLESLARAIFKSWFVDFDPVKINAGQMPASSAIPTTHDPKVLDLFPSTFQDSELGPIPDGWLYHSLPDVTTFREGPGILAKDFHDEGVPLIRLAGLKNDVSLLAGCNFLDPAKVEKKWSHFRLEKGDVLLSTSASLGRVAEVNDEAVGAIPYTGLIGFRPIESITNRRYIRHYLTSSHFQEQVEAMGVGSVLKHFGPTHLKQMKMLVPPLAIQNEFKQAVAKMDEMISKNLLQSAQLAANRDTLLPQLLSGELPVPKGLTATEEALV